MKNLFTKRNLLTLLVVLWVLFSVAYIVRDQWMKFQTVTLNNAYQSGAKAAIHTIITASDGCKGVPLFEGDKKVTFVSVDCLKPPATPQK